MDDDFLKAVFMHTVSVVFCSIWLFACEQIRQVMEGFGQATGVMDLESKLRPNQEEVMFVVVCVVLCYNLVKTDWFFLVTCCGFWFLKCCGL